MNPHPNSPQACFERNGYQMVECHHKAGPNKWDIYNQDGVLLLQRQNYTSSLNYCKERGWLIELPTDYVHQY